VYFLLKLCFVLGGSLRFGVSGWLVVGRLHMADSTGMSDSEESMLIVSEFITSMITDSNKLG